MEDQADFSRWLGWVWGDGLPHDEDNLTGVRYTGPSSAQFSARYNEVVDRLRMSPLGLVLDNGSNRRRIIEPWDYWTNAIPGGNVNDPKKLLRDAVRNPNFLAGIIDTEGGNCNSTNSYYIDDHTFSPSHPDGDRGWGLLNFGPYRMIELFHLIGDTYGFEKTNMQIGTQGSRYEYVNEVEREMAITEVINRFNAAQAFNINATNNGEPGISVRVRIYIDNEDWDTFRSYGYWTNPSRYPRCGDEVDAIVGSMPLVDLPLADCEKVGPRDMDEPNVLWYLRLFLDADATFTTTNGLAEIDIQTAGTAPWHVSLRHEDVVLELGKSYHLSYDAYADDDRAISVVSNNSNSSLGYFFTNQQITTVPTNYTHEFTMNESTDYHAFLRFNVGGVLAHNVYIDNIRLVEAECICPTERFFFNDMLNVTGHFESSQQIFGFNEIESSSIIFDAGHGITLGDGFEVKIGASFEAFIDGCD